MKARAKVSRAVIISLTLVMVLLSALGASIFFGFSGFLAFSSDGDESHLLKGSSSQSCSDIQSIAKTPGNQLTSQSNLEPFKIKTPSQHLGDFGVYQDEDPEDLSETSEDDGGEDDYSEEDLDGDGVDDYYEAINSRDLEIEIGQKEFYIYSEKVSGGVENYFEVYVEGGDEGLEVYLYFASESSSREYELEFELSVISIIEFKDDDGNSGFTQGSEISISQTKLTQFKNLNYEEILSSSGDKVHNFSLGSQNGIFQMNMYVSSSFTQFENQILAPSQVKMDFLIYDYPYVEEQSMLALKTQIESESESAEYEESEETESEKEGWASNESEVKISANNEVSGFFSWSKIALIDGVERGVYVNRYGGQENSNTLYFNYPRGKDIFHDPKIGVQGILEQPTPSTPGFFDNTWMIVLISALIVLTTVILSKQEYREYLLNRVLHINTAPHRLDMRDVVENETRSQIIDQILENPGIHFNQLLEHLELSPGSLVWHLDILETYKVVKKQRVGQYVVFYPYIWDNPISKIEVMFKKSRNTLEIYKIICDKPGVFQKVIANRLSLDHKTVKYHIKKLLETELIFSEKKGRKKHYYPTELRKIETDD